MRPTALFVQFTAKRVGCSVSTISEVDYEKNARRAPTKTGWGIWNERFEDCKPRTDIMLRTRNNETNEYSV